MSRKSVSIAVSLLMLLAVLPASFADADTRHAMNLTVNQPVAVPGAVLQPGHYTLKFTNDSYNRVLIRQADGHVVGLFPVISAYRAEPTKDMEIDVLHSGSGARISSWFMPGATTGWEFIYSGKAPRELAQGDKSIVAGK